MAYFKLIFSLIIIIIIITIIIIKGFSKHLNVF